jgi:hypothetical protein
MRTQHINKTTRKRQKSDKKTPIGAQFQATYLAIRASPQIECSYVLLPLFALLLDAAYLKFRKIGYSTLV